MNKGCAIFWFVNYVIHCSIINCYFCGFKACSQISQNLIPHKFYLFGILYLTILVLCQSIGAVCNHIFGGVPHAIIGRAKRAPHWGVQSRFRVIYICACVCRMSN